MTRDLVDEATDRLATWRTERARLEQTATAHPAWAATAQQRIRKLDVLIRNAERALQIFDPRHATPSTHA